MATFQSGFQTILATKLEPADTSMVVATAPTVTSGRLFLKSGTTKERISFTGVSSTTLTGLTRNLSTTSEPATAGTGLSRLAGTKVKIVAMHDQLLDVERTGARTLKGDYTFSGANTNTGTQTATNKITISGANGELDMSGAKKALGVPQLTTTERNALTPKNGDFVYDTNIGLFYQYKGGAWASVDTGTSTPNASETVAGSVEIATTSEFNAGTNTGGTGAILVAKPSDIQAMKTSLQTEIDSVPDITDTTYPAGETITAGQTVFPETGPTFAVATTVQNIGDVTGNTRWSDMLVGDGVAFTTKKMSLKKFLSPGVDLGVRIETNNASNPSGTPVTNGTTTFLASALTTSLADTTITFPGSVTLLDGVVYHIVLFAGTYGAETVNASNYFGIGTSTNDTTTRASSYYDGTSWLGGLNVKHGDLFTGTTISGKWDNVGFLQDGYAYVDVSYNTNTTPYLNNLKSKILVDFNDITLQFKTDTVAGSDQHCGLFGLAGLFIDTSNFICFYASSGVGTGNTRSYKLQIKQANSLVYDTAVTVADGDILKIEHNRSTGLTKFYKVSAGVWSQLGTNQTFVLAGDMYAYTTAYQDNDIGGGGSFGGGHQRGIDDLYLYNTTSTTYYSVINKGFPYISGVGIYNSMLSLTDSDFSYKLDMLGISKENKNIGEKPKITIGGINASLTGLTADTVYYLNATPGGIGTTAGTNKCVVGKTLIGSTTQIKLNKKLHDVSITVGASPFTRVNTTNSPVQVKITAGTVSDVKVKGITVATATSTLQTVSSGDSIVTTHSSTPTMVYTEL